MATRKKNKRNWQLIIICISGFILSVYIVLLMNPEYEPYTLVDIPLAVVIVIWLFINFILLALWGGIEWTLKRLWNG
jgi:hypothetical protein